MFIVHHRDLWAQLYLPCNFFGYGCISDYPDEITDTLSVSAITSLPKKTLRLWKNGRTRRAIVFSLLHYKMNTIAMIVVGLLAVYLVWALFFSGPKTFPTSYYFPALVTLVALGGVAMTVGFA